jgi:hypothetical protein
VEPAQPIVFYICPTCFRVCETEQECHEHQMAFDHQMVACNPGSLGDERRKPVNNRYGQYASRAPRWFLEALGWIVEDDD